MRLYLAYPSSRYLEAKILKRKLEKSIPSNIEVFFPIQVEKHVSNEIAFSDLENVRNSSIFLCYMLEPSVGVSCELTYFKCFHNFSRPAIGFNCIENPFLKLFLDHIFQESEFESLVKYLLNYSLVCEKI